MYLKHGAYIHFAFHLYARAHGIGLLLYQEEARALAADALWVKGFVNAKEVIFMLLHIYPSAIIFYVEDQFVSQVVCIQLYDEWLVRLAEINSVGEQVEYDAVQTG